MTISLEILLESVINEGRTKSVIDKWSNYVIPGYEGRGPMKNDEEWDYVIKTVISPQNDPSGNGKYVDWVLARLIDYIKDSLSRDENPPFMGELDFLLELVSSFHKFSERNLIQDKDIYNPKYRDVRIVGQIIGEASKKAQELTKERELKAGADKIYQDSRWLVIVPKTHEASCHYGAGTKWCTTAKNSPSYFTQYSSLHGGNGVLFYILDKTRKSGTLYKLAIHKSFAPGKDICDNTEEGYRYCFQSLVTINSDGTGFDEEDKEVNLKYIIPLLPEGIMTVINQYYQKELITINNKRKNDVIKRVNEEQGGLRKSREVIHSRVKELKTTFINVIKRDNYIFDILEDLLEDASVSNTRFNSIYGHWRWMIIDNGKRFQIFNPNEYPEPTVEEHRDYFIDGIFLPDENISTSFRLYKQKEDGGFGDVDSADAISEREIFEMGDPFHIPEFHKNFIELMEISITELYGRHLSTTSKNNHHVNMNETIYAISDEKWNAERIITNVFNTDSFNYLIELFIETLSILIEGSLTHILFKSNVPSKDGSVFWKPNSGESTYRFEYPADPNSMTVRFLNYVRENPGVTADDFYRNVLGKRRAAGNNSTFFSSIKDAGLVRIQRNGRRFGYYIGPNYETWTQGKLKRV